MSGHLKHHRPPGEPYGKKTIKPGDDKSMILHPDEWPRWPILPVKRYLKEAQNIELGVMMAGQSTTIYLTDMFDLNMSSAKRKVYGTLDDLLADSWVVD
jgi:hypothetical protein